MTIANKQQSAKAEAILYIKSYGDSVQTGDKVRYAQPSEGGGHSRSEFVVEPGDLTLAKMAREGTAELTRTDAARMTAWKA